MKCLYKVTYAGTTYMFDNMPAAAQFIVQARERNLPSKELENKIVELTNTLRKPFEQHECTQAQYVAPCKQCQQSEESRDEESLFYTIIRLKADIFEDLKKELTIDTETIFEDASEAFL